VEAEGLGGEPGGTLGATNDGATDVQVRGDLVTAGKHEAGQLRQLTAEVVAPVLQLVDGSLIDPQRRSR
jgi:hypothetical protein